MSYNIIGNLKDKEFSMIISLSTHEPIEKIANTADRIFFSFSLEEVFYGMGEEYYESIVELASIKEGYKVLDIGCGTGTLVIYEKRRVKDKGYVAGIDVSSKILKLSKKKIAKEDIDLKIGSIEKIPYEDDFFDVITCSMVTHHLSSEEKKKGFSEVYRALKPRGHFLLVDIGKPTNLTKKIFLKPFGYIMKSMKDNINGRLPYLLREAGFRQVKIVKKKRNYIDFISAFK